MRKDEKQLILGLLKKEPQGMTIQDLTRAGKMNRFTATIYIHELLGEGKITERKIGAYRLFKLKNK
jgi:predicted transcriptional regulator